MKLVCFLLFICIESILPNDNCPVFFEDDVLTQIRLINDETLDKFPVRFRTSEDIKKQNGVNKRGLDRLRMVGSGQFTKVQLENVLKHRYLVGRKIIVIDLRQESHGFISGMPITWYCPYDWSLRYHTHEYCIIDQALRLEILSNKEEIEVSTKKNTGTSKKYPVNFVRSEAELCKELEGFDLTHYDFKITDHCIPENETVEMLLETFKLHSIDDHTFYFHCRGGAGRTTTAMAMFDMWFNPNLSFDDILKRQEGLGRSLTNPERSRGTYKYECAVSRLEFIKMFYLYSQSPRSVSWTEFVTRLEGKTFDLFKLFINKVS